MKKLRAFLVALVCVLGLIGCADSGNGTETVVFHNHTFKSSDLSHETLEWLAWYNELSETEQLAISYIPSDLHKLCGYDPMADAPAETK